MHVILGKRCPEMSDPLNETLGLTGHIVAELDGQQAAEISIVPISDPNAESDAADDTGDRRPRVRLNPIVEDVEGTGLIAPLPGDPTPTRGRAPVQFQPTGYVEIGAGTAFTDRPDEGPRMDGQGVYSQAEFEKMLDALKQDDGQFVAMTAYGAVPVPQELMENVPEKFLEVPQYEEHETFVLKTKNHDRTTERDFTQYTHHFVESVKKGKIDKLVPSGEKKEVVIPRYHYKAVIAENVLEVPQVKKFVMFSLTFDDTGYPIL